MSTMTDTCTSTFVVPGEQHIRHCAGRPEHTGVMHAGDGAAWGDDAAADNHPAEPLLIRTARLAAIVHSYGEVLRAVADLHRDRGGRCAHCCRTSPCPTATLLGLDRTPTDQ